MSRARALSPRCAWRSRISAGKSLARRSELSGRGRLPAGRRAMEDFGGKALEKPIELVVADHQNKPDIASGIARKWFDVEKVDMIANLINSSIALSVSQLAKEKDRIRS